MISARIIADSYGPGRFNRLTSAVIVIPRIVLAEFNTHRMISKNSASSRAIPHEIMIKNVATNPFIPLAFQRQHKGMQGSEVFEGKEHDVRVSRWLQARDSALVQSCELGEMGVTKQICNRLLEPFFYHTIIATSSERGWENFFALRAHEAAEIHIQKAAYEMLNAYNESTPKILQRGEWHIPFGDTFDDSRIDKIAEQDKDFWREDLNQFHLDQIKQNIKVKIASARCARVSYQTFEGEDNYEKDIKLHDRLLNDGHMSPLEHCAQYGDYAGDMGGNFGVGWKQYRKNFTNECRTETRVIRK